ncbi:MAG TPA: DUF5985 family protein [Terracidiphilus sp.]|jgi:uncharacterized membrane protein HdeD (DUF308 family)|nr:DUF5985 family protein [Terracidiphilus sp.]
MNPIVHPVLDTFLLGFIVACSLAAGVFFFRFWRNTRDPLFLAFAIFFFAQACSNTVVLDLPHPNEGAGWLFLFRLLSVLVVLGAILWKNTGKE